MVDDGSARRPDCRARDRAASGGARVRVLQAPVRGDPLPQRGSGRHRSRIVQKDAVGASGRRGRLTAVTSPQSPLPREPQPTATFHGRAAAVTAVLTGAIAIADDWHAAIPAVVAAPFLVAVFVAWMGRDDQLGANLIAARRKPLVVVLIECIGRVLYNV